MTGTKTAEPGTAIYAAMIAIASEIPSIAKEQKNAAQGYSFRGVDQVFNSIQPVLAKHGVFITCEILDLKREERPSKSGGIMAFVTVRARYSFIAKDGSFVSTESAGEGADSGDKATAKSLSIAMKYALLQVFTIPTLDAKDPENDNPELAPKKPASQPPAKNGEPPAGDDFLDEPAPPDAFAYLKELAAAKKAVGDGIYYGVLASWQVNHANEIAIEERAAVLEALRDAYRKNSKKAAAK